MGVLVFAAGLALMLWAHHPFIRNGCEINPYKAPRNLMTTGAFAHSRNPMYLAFIVMLAGISLFANDWGALLTPAVFFAIANGYFIRMEEERAEDTFGADYLAYKGRVRRWL
ncbi:Putative protein-S-isoprenylcysteine methyltransferase [Rhodovulum sp. P5]|nr:Putative protein-S-isoprenylcysteine methyltransferase [Rhodovulum sp. P5]